MNNLFTPECRLMSIRMQKSILRFFFLANCNASSALFLVFAESGTGFFSSCTGELNKFPESLLRDSGVQDNTKKTVRMKLKIFTPITYNARKSHNPKASTMLLSVRRLLRHCLPRCCRYPESCIFLWHHKKHQCFRIRRW